MMNNATFARMLRGGVVMRLIYSFRIDKNDKVYSELETISKVSKNLYERDGKPQK